MAGTAFDRRVAELRRFNRFTPKKPACWERGCDSAFSLTEARVLDEIALAEHPTAADLGKRLGLDRGYLSRNLRGFERRGLICRTASAADRRLTLVLLAVIIADTIRHGAPSHARLAQRFDVGVHARLVRTNWIRTVAWSTLGVLDLIALAGLWGWQGRAPG